MVNVPLAEQALQLTRTRCASLTTFEARTQRRIDDKTQRIVTVLRLSFESASLQVLASSIKTNSACACLPLILYLPHIA